jgi:hypothetical protein
VFIDGTELDRYYETAEGIIWVAGLVHIRSEMLLIDNLLIYPATGARLNVGALQMLEIVRSLEDEAIAQGLSAFTVEAERMYENKPRRMICISRRLR